jgi:integrase
VLNTAVDDGSIKKNPCRIKGPGQHRTPERPTATVQQVYALAELMPARFRVLVLAAAMTGLRWGELITLRRRDFDLSTGTVAVHRRIAQLRQGEMQVGPTKSAAGVRTVALPAVLVPELQSHISKFAEERIDGLVFTGSRKSALRRGNFHRETKWTKTVINAGLPAGFHFHDLRHTGNQLAASAGASTRELMHRMGHGSMRAALIYQHATSDRDRGTADRMSALVEAGKPQPAEPVTNRDNDVDDG